MTELEKMLEKAIETCNVLRKQRQEAEAVLSGINDNIAVVEKMIEGLILMKNNVEFPPQMENTQEKNMTNWEKTFEEITETYASIDAMRFSALSRAELDAALARYKKDIAEDAKQD